MRLRLRNHPGYFCPQNPQITQDVNSLHPEAVRLADVTRVVVAAPLQPHQLIETRLGARPGSPDAQARVQPPRRHGAVDDGLCAGKRPPLRCWWWWWWLVARGVFRYRGEDGAAGHGTGNVRLLVGARRGRIIPSRARGAERGGSGGCGGALPLPLLLLETSPRRRLDFHVHSINSGDIFRCSSNGMCDVTER